MIPLITVTSIDNKHFAFKSNARFGDPANDVITLIRNIFPATWKKELKLFVLHSFYFNMFVEYCQEVAKTEININLNHSLTGIKSDYNKNGFIYWWEDKEWFNFVDISGNNSYDLYMHNFPISRKFGLQHYTMNRRFPFFQHFFDHLHSMWLNGGFITEKIDVTQMPTWTNVEEPPDDFVFENAVLDDIQKETVRQAYLHDGLFIADEMGIGKTHASLGAAVKLRKGPVIVFCKATPKKKWATTAELEFGLTPCILEGTKGSKLPKADIYILNYQIAQAWSKYLIATKPDVLIVDEVHFAKNPQAKRTKEIIKVAQKCRRRYLLTGTAHKNHTIDLHSQLQILALDAAPPWLFFAYRYCDAEDKPWGLDVSGTSNHEELRNLISAYGKVRRRKKDFPEKFTQKETVAMPVDLTPEGKRKYRKLVEDYEKEWNELTAKRELFRSQGKDDEAKEISKKLLGMRLSMPDRLRQCTGKYKLAAVKTFINELLEEEDKLVVFCHWKAVLDDLQAAYPDNSVRLDGKVLTTGSKRFDLMESFQNDPSINLFLGSIGAAGDSIDLFSAARTIIIDIPWTPTDIEQAEGRIHRRGQLRDVVFYIMIATGTIEEWVISDKLITKQSNSDAIMDDGDFSETEVYKSLISTVREKLKQGDVSMFYGLKGKPVE